METLKQQQDEFDSESTAFYSWLGKAIARWASVEWALSQVFWQALGKPDQNAAVTVFFSNHAFYSKVKMVHDALLVKYGEAPLMEEWKSVYSDLIKKSKTRNNLAHAPVTFVPQAKKGRRFFVNVGSMNPVTAPGVARRARTNYYVDNLEEIERVFRKLASDVSRFEYLVERVLKGEPL